MAEERVFRLRPVGFVRSELRSRDEAPRQGHEGAPDAWLEMEEAVREGLLGIEAGQEVVVVTWFHLARRDVLTLHPRRDAALPLRGVFATRSPDRPNPLALHRVTVREVAGLRLRVGPLEAVDGTPVLDIRPVLQGSDDG